MPGQRHGRLPFQAHEKRQARRENRAVDGAAQGGRMNAYKFRDEWILRALKTLPMITEQIIQDCRNKKAPSLMAAALEKNLITESQLTGAIKNTFHIDSISGNVEKIDKTAVSMVPEK